MENEEANVIRVEKSEKTLLQRYDIPVEHLSYEFISECTNGKLLERIVTILRSGEEGYYPDLIKHAEERLTVIKPSSIILRRCEPVYTRNMLEPSEIIEIDNDIKEWMSEMQCREKDLEDGKATLINEPFPQPDIRQYKDEIVKKNRISSTKNSDKTVRIKSCDYAAWDKYDADTEINKIDIREEQRQIEIKRHQRRQREMNEKKEPAETTINKSSLTGTELEIMAEREREKGNEAFRAGDYTEALKHYNFSITIDSNLIAFNNRAMTFIKLQRYEDALSDCNLVLSTEYTNVKALLRRALSLEHLERASQALADYETVLKLEPTNKTAIAGIKKLRKPCESRKVRMAIEEMKEDEELRSDQTREKNNHVTELNANLDTDNCICFCDGAPGPSRDLKPRLHLKADYCLDYESRQKLSVKNNASNDAKFFSRKTEAGNNSREKVKFKSTEIVTTLSSSAKNNSKVSNSICQTSVAPNAKAKSIFSYVTPPVSSVIIEELPKEACDTSSANIKNKFNEGPVTKIEPSRKINDKHRLNTNRKNCTGKNPNRVERVGLNEKCEANVLSKKIQVADKYENKTSKSEKNTCKKINNVNSPYEFILEWQSLRNDNDLKLHANLLRSLKVDNLNAGNKLDGTMLSTILRCLEQHFCTPSDSELLKNFLKSFSQVNRFSIVSMFMNTEDKGVAKNIFKFLEEQGTSEVSLLRNVYCI